MLIEAFWTLNIASSQFVEYLDQVREAKLGFIQTGRKAHALRGPPTQSAVFPVNCWVPGYCSVFRCTILSSGGLFCLSVYCSVFRCTVLPSGVLFYLPVCCSVFRCNVLSSCVLSSGVLFCISVYYFVFRCNVLSSGVLFCLPV